jgi:hypothetical protein
VGAHHEIHDVAVLALSIEGQIESEALDAFAQWLDVDQNADLIYIQPLGLLPKSSPQMRSFRKIARRQVEPWASKSHGVAAIGSKATRREIECPASSAAVMVRPVDEPGLPEPIEPGDSRGAPRLPSAVARVVDGS